MFLFDLELCNKMAHIKPDKYCLKPSNFHYIKQVDICTIKNSLNVETLAKQVSS